MTAVMKTDNLPAHLRAYAGKTGTEDIGQQDIATPRLVLLQALSPQLEEDDTLRGGEFYHSGAEIGLGNEIQVIPLLVSKAYTLWRPRPEGGILARSFDGIKWDRTGVWTDIKLKGGKIVTWKITSLDVDRSGLNKFGSSDPDNPNSQPAAVLAYNIPMLIVGHENYGPAVLSMQRSQIKVARKLMGRLKLQQVPLCGLQIPLSSIKEQGPEGPFFQVKFGKFGYVEDEDRFHQAKALFDMFQEKGVAVQMDEEGPEENRDDESDIPY